MKLLFALTVHFHYSFITTRTRTHIGTNVRIFWIEVVLSLFDWSFACAAHTLANGFNMSSEAVINYWHIKFYILTTKLLYFDDFIIFLAIYPTNKFDDRMWRYERCVCVCVRVVKTVCSRTLVCTLHIHAYRVDYWTHVLLIKILRILCETNDRFLKYFDILIVTNISFYL